jgi:hypothetical protein
VTQAPAYHLERRARKRDRNRFTFSILGNDTQLCTLPVEEPEPTHIADEMNVPTAIRRRAFDERPGRVPQRARDDRDRRLRRARQIANLPATLSGTRL